MNNYYLRVEGVNLVNYVYDTGDLSTIRGGGLLLLDIPRWVEEKETETTLFPVTKGASWGLFRFMAEDECRAWEVGDRIRNRLRNGRYRHATIMVEVLPAAEGDDYVEIREKLDALTRWDQMASLSMALPTKVSGEDMVFFEEDGKTPKMAVCEMDYVSPAVKPITKGGQELGISASVFNRRNHGKGVSRKKWYQDITKINEIPEFIFDFHELAEPWGEQDYGNLNNKMAVIYLDGNGFGKRQRTYCTSPEKQRKFDQKIRKEFQNRTLGDLLREIIDNPCDWFFTDEKNDQRARFETLLWGGDEIIWVAPAWKGWWLLAKFFQLVQDNWTFDGSALTLSAGLVFCHCKAPIGRITDLAKALGDLAKGDRSANKAAYQVLESFDHAGPDLAAFRQSRCPGMVQESDLILNGNAMFDLIKTVERVKADIPKRRLHRYVEGLYREPGGEDECDLKAWIDEELMKKITDGLGSEPACWLHLLDLWDYIGEESISSKEAPHGSG